MKSTNGGVRVTRMLSAGIAAAFIGTIAVAPATGLPSDASESLAQLIVADGVQASLLEAVTARSGNPSDPGPDDRAIGADVLQGLLDVDVSGIELPVIADGDNGGLFDLGPLAGAGALNAFAASPTSETSTAAVGTVGDDGAVDLSPLADPSDVDNATLELTGLLDQLGVSGLTADVLDEVSVGLGAVAARAQASGVETYTSQYVLADAELRFHSAAIGGLADDLDAAYDPLIAAAEVAVQDAVGPGGAIDDALEALTLPTVTVPGVATVALDRPTATVDVDLPGLNEALLQEAVSDDGLVTIDLTDGTIRVDVAQLVKGPGATDLNNLPANTSVLTDDTIEAITAGVGEALGNLVDSIDAELEEALQEAVVSVALSGTVSLLDDSATAPLAFSASGSLADFAGISGEGPQLSTIADVVLTPPAPADPVTIPAAVLLELVAEPTLALVQDALAPVVETLLTSESDAVEEGLVAVSDEVLEPFEPVLDGVLRQIATLTINEQPTAPPINAEGGDLGPGSFTVRALAIDMLPDLLDIGVDLASASVRASDLPATVTASPNPVQQGGDVNATGEGFAPNAEVTVTYVDSDGVTVATSTVTTDASGGFADAVVLPVDVALGELTITADDGEESAQDSVQVIAAATEPGVSAAPDPVQAGGTVQVAGVGFAPSSPVTVTYVDADGTTVATSTVTSDGAGGFADAVVLPADVALGELTITADDGEDSAQDSVQVIAAATEAGVSAAPDPVQAGGTVQVAGVGFAPNSPVTVTYVDADGTTVATSTLTSDGAGGFADAVVLPADVALGELTITADDGEETAQDSVQVIAAATEPSVQVGPDLVEIGDTITVVGAGFEPNRQVTIVYTDADGNVVGQDTAITDGSGAFNETFVVPEGTAPGALTVTAADGTYEASDTTTVLDPGTGDAPGIDVTPGTVRPGEEITTTCSGFAPNVPVTITYTDAEGNVVATRDVTTDADSACTDTLRLPQDVALGPLTVEATGGGDTATDVVQVVETDAISITIEHETRYRGELQTGYGYGYVPGTVVHGYMNSTPSLDLGTQIADAEGTVTFTWIIPASAAIDTHTFSLTAAQYPDQSITFQVLATPAAALPETGSDAAMPGLTAVGLVLVGLLLLAATRHERRRRARY